MFRKIKLAFILSIPFSIVAVLAVQAVTMISITFDESGKQILKKGISAISTTISNTGVSDYLVTSLPQYVTVFIIVFLAMVTYSLFNKHG